MSSRTDYFLIDDLDPEELNYSLASQAFNRIEQFAMNYFKGEFGWNAGLLVMKNRLIVLDDPDNDRGPWETLADDITKKCKPEEYVPHLLREALLAFCAEAEIKGLDPYFGDETVFKILEALPTNELIELITTELVTKLRDATNVEYQAVTAPGPETSHDTWLRGWNITRFSTYYNRFRESSFKPFSLHETDPYKYRFFDLRDEDSAFDEAQHGLVLIEVNS